MPKNKPRRRQRARSQARERALSQSANAIRLRRLRGEAVKRGLCLVCRHRYPKAGLKICPSCYERKNERAAGYVASGLCSCGRKRAPNKMRCTSCDVSNERSRTKRTTKLASIGRCVACGHGWPKPPNKTCASCIANTNAYGMLRQAINRATGLCACGRKRKQGFQTCTLCQLKATVHRVRGAVAVRAAR